MFEYAICLCEFGRPVFRVISGIAASPEAMGEVVRQTAKINTIDMHWYAQCEFRHVG